MSRSKLAPADIVERDARIVKLYNAGLSTSALGTRFSLTQATVASILDVARKRGDKVRKPEGNSRW